MNKQREKLIELICTVDCEGGEDFLSCPERRNGHCRSIHKLEMCQLGAIADHILADEEIKRAFELLKAEKEGRLLETPCKVGDEVYTILISGTKFQITRGIITWFKDEKGFEKTWEVEALCLDEHGAIAGIANVLIHEKDFGHLWYLSREEAEKALEEMEREMRKDKYKIQVGDKLYEASKSYHKVFEWEVLEIWLEDYIGGNKTIVKCSNGTWTKEFLCTSVFEFYDTYEEAEKALEERQENESL